MGIKKKSKMKCSTFNVPGLAERVGVSEGGIPDCVLGVSQGCVTLSESMLALNIWQEIQAMWLNLVVQDWVGNAKATQESPHICILPGQHRMDPHHLQSMKWGIDDSLIWRMGGFVVHTLGQSPSVGENVDM